MFYFQTIRKARDSIFKLKVKKILRYKFRVLAFFVPEWFRILVFYLLLQKLVPCFSIFSSVGVPCFSINRTKNVFRFREIPDFSSCSGSGF
jgi:hypothetical protein